jgi:hypothetical protein
LDKVNKILTFLDDAGIGNPKKINDVLKDIYYQPDHFDSDHEYFEYAGRIENFLRELQNANLIKYRIEGFFRVKMQGKYFLLDDCRIMASITYKGSKSLEKDEANQIVYSTTFHGPFLGNFNQGEGSPQQSFSEPIKSEKPKWLTLNFYWEELIKYWYKLILGIIGVALLSWLGFSLFSNKSSSTKKRNPVGLIQNDSDSNNAPNKNKTPSTSEILSDTSNLVSNQIYLQSYRPVELLKGSLLVTLNNSIEAINQEIELKLFDKNSLKTELLKNKKIGDVIRFDKYLITLLSLEKNIQTYDLVIKIEIK